MVTILGAGVAGVSLAWALARRGRRDVVVFDPAAEPSGSTAKALGGFRTQHGSELNIKLALASRDFFVQRAEHIHFQPNGYLYLAETPEAAVELRRRADFQTACGLPVEHPDPRAIVPWLDDAGIQGANFCALDGLYIPLEILGAYLEEARGLGVDFRLGREAGSRDLAADIVVVACGVASPAVGETLEVTLAVEAVERGVFMTGPYDWLGDRVPMTLEAGSGFHFRERDRRLWVMGPGEQHDWGRIRDWLAMRAPRALVQEPDGFLTGNYEVTFDHHPLVGETARHGIWASCGFSGHGVMQSPAVADSLAAMINGDSPPLDIRALSPQRTEPLIDTTQL
ncbi:MAG TPA: FAD-binding oxidoreductase [Candidatus Dormibacteraeota bacterium]|nr:FAD-binding oxidoreductase [Candidatus Dormibacteraeota bacterium]